MATRGVYVLVWVCVIGALVQAMPPVTRLATGVRSKRGIKGGSRSTDATAGNGCKTFADGSYECRHSYGYGDKNPFDSATLNTHNSLAASLNARDLLGGFENDKSGCQTFPDGSFECRRGYSYSSSTHGWNQNDPLTSGSLLNLDAVSQDLAALGTFDRNQNGCRTFPDGSWECKRSWGYGSTSETQTALNAGTDYSDVRGGSGSLGRDDKGCRTFTDGSWECRRGYSYNAATGWNIAAAPVSERRSSYSSQTSSQNVVIPVAERRSTYNAQSSTQNVVQVRPNGGFDTTQRGCRTYADGSWECKPEWGYRSTADVQTATNSRERENIRNPDRNGASRTGYTSTQERQDVFSSSGVSSPNVGTGNPRENLRNPDRNGASRTYSATQEREDVFSNSGVSSPHVGTSPQDRVPDLAETPTGCSTLPDGSTECRRGYSYSARHERNYTTALKPANREVASSPTSYSSNRGRESLVNGGVNIGLDTQVRENVAVSHNSGSRVEMAPVRTSYAAPVRGSYATPVRTPYAAPVPGNEAETPDYQRPAVPNVNTEARHEYSYTQEQESIRNGGDISGGLGLNNYPRAPSADSYTVTTPRPSSYSGAVANPQRPAVPNVNTDERREYSYTQEQGSVLNGGAALGLSTYPRAPSADSYTTPRPSSYGGGVVNSNRGRVYQEPKSVSRTSSYSQTQQREVVNSGAVNGVGVRPDDRNTEIGSNTHAREDFGDVSNVRVVPSYGSSLPVADLRTPVVASGATASRSYSYTQEKQVVNHGGVVNNPSLGLSLGTGLNTGLSTDHLSDIRAETGSAGGSVGGNGCKTNPDGSTVCTRGYSHSSTQERQVYSGGRSRDLVVPHEEPGMVMVVGNPNAPPPQPGCRTLPDGSTECVRGHSETRQWGGGTGIGSHLAGGESLVNEDRRGGGHSQGYDFVAEEERRLTGGHQGSRRGEVEGVKTGRRTSSYSSSSSQSHRVGGVSSPTQNSGRYTSSEGSQRHTASMGDVALGGSIAEVHSEQYVKSGSSGRGTAGCALVAGSPCNRNGQQASYGLYGSTGFRTGTLEV